eukprot:4900648-Amphidinium_carterae.2
MVYSPPSSREMHRTALFFAPPLINHDVVLSLNEGKQLLQVSEHHIPRVLAQLEPSWTIPRVREACLPVRVHSTAGSPRAFLDICALPGSRNPVAAIHGCTPLSSSGDENNVVLVLSSKAKPTSFVPKLGTLKLDVTGIVEGTVGVTSALSLAPNRTHSARSSLHSCCGSTNDGWIHAVHPET